MMRASCAASTSIASVLSGPIAPRSKSAAVARRIDSRGPPRRSRTIKRDVPKPLAARSFAKAVGASPSEVSARIRAAGCRCGRMRSSARPCSDNSTVCGSDQPSRPAARLKADGAGTTTISRGSMRRASTAPTPYWTDRRTPARKPGGRDAASTSSAAPSNGLGHGRAAPRISGAARPCGGGRRTRFQPPRSARVPLRSGRQRRPRQCRRWTASAAMRQCRARSAQVILHESRVLILGGTTEARVLGERLAAPRLLDVTLSLVGRTADARPARGAFADGRLWRRRGARRLSYDAQDRGFH